MNYVAHDGDLIWGCGATPDSAIRDAARMDASESFLGSLAAEPATESLVLEVERRGGAIAYRRLRSGMMGTWGEWERECPDE